MNRIGIYRILNLINFMVYVGSSLTLDPRRTKHFRLLRLNKHPNPHLQASYNKYGHDNFTFEILEECPKEDLLIREKYYIDLYDATNENKGYNIRKDPSSNAGFKHSEETKKKIGMWGKGRKHTEEEKQKMREALKNRDQSGKNNPCYGRKLSEKHKAAIIKWNKERPRILLEIRICACGCKETFECKINSKKKFIPYHQLRGRKFPNREGTLRPNNRVILIDKVCLCGCDMVFKATKGNRNKYINREHYENSAKIKREIRSCLCGCGSTFLTKINSKKHYISGHNSKGKTIVFTQEHKDKLRKSMKEFWISKKVINNG